MGGAVPRAPLRPAPTTRSCCDRYKMTCEYTWPNHLLGSDKAAVGALLEQHGLQGDVAFGHSKLFIRSPRTLVALGQRRAGLLPLSVLLREKVGGRPPVREGVGDGKESVVRFPGGGGERRMGTTGS